MQESKVRNLFFDVSRKQVCSCGSSYNQCRKTLWEKRIKLMSRNKLWRMCFFLAYYVCLNHSNDVTLDVTTEPINLRQQTNFIPKADSVTIFLLWLNPKLWNSNLFCFDTILRKWLRIISFITALSICFVCFNWKTFRLNNKTILQETVGMHVHHNWFLGRFDHHRSSYRCLFNMSGQDHELVRSPIMDILPLRHSHSSSLDGSDPLARQILSKSTCIRSASRQP